MLARQTNGAAAAKHERSIVIAIVDYKAGNLTSVKKAVHHLGAETVVTADPAEVQLAEKIILPGVGHFAATKVLGDSGLRETIIEQIERGVPFLQLQVILDDLREIRRCLNRHSFLPFGAPVLGSV